MTTDKDYQKALEFAIAQCWADGERHIDILESGVEVYAYKHPQGVAWGINRAEDGFNIRGGIRKEDGSDEAVK